MAQFLKNFVFTSNFKINTIMGNSFIVRPEKNRQMSIKVAQNDFTRKMIDLTPLQKLPMNVRDLGK